MAPFELVIFHVSFPEGIQIKKKFFSQSTKSILKTFKVPKQLHVLVSILTHKSVVSLVGIPNPLEYFTQFSWNMFQTSNQDIIPLLSKMGTPKKTKNNNFQHQFRLISEITHFSPVFQGINYHRFRTGRSSHHYRAFGGQG